MFEIYERTEGRKKTYIVTNISGHHSIYELGKYARRYFKSSSDKIIIKAAWVMNDELYLVYPDNKKAKAVYVAYLK